MADVVFAARGLTKTYRNGEIEVHALAGVDLDLFAGELRIGGGRIRGLCAQMILEIVDVHVSPGDAPAARPDPVDGHRRR